MPHFFDRKETRRKETLEPELHSLNNINCSSRGKQTRLRSDSACPCYSLANIIGSFRKGSNLIF